MGEDHEERELSILRELEGCREKYSSIYEFKQHLNEAYLAEEELESGWVFWRGANERRQQQLDQYELQHHHSNNTTHQLQHKIISLLKLIASDKWLLWCHYLIQFWGVVKVEGEGRHHYFSTSNYPFSVDIFLRKGVSLYRNLCTNRKYAEVEQLGGVGRAYRNKHPESTPDLRLYSTEEFPLRDHAASCGFRGYLALPLFDFHNNECYGVLELFSHKPTTWGILLSTLDRGLQIVELRSTHINFIPISRSTNDVPDKYKQQPESEIMEILELAIKADPQLSLAQVWAPCKQCANLCCMERASFITAQDKISNRCEYIDWEMFDYLQACEFHNLQVDLISSTFRLNICDLSISKNPLAHYAERARLSRCLQIYLQSTNNRNPFLVIEFYLQPKCREDSSLYLLLRIMEMKLNSFKFVLGGPLLEEFVDQSRQSNTIEPEDIEMLKVMNSCKGRFSESNFTKYLETVDVCCLRPSSLFSNEGWVFCPPAGEGLYENYVKEKIEHFMIEIAAIFGIKYGIVQFWAPIMVEDRYCLETSDQPYAVGCLAKGVASFRKKCMQHHYFVDEEAKEEELGPPGRVFRKGHPEVIHDLSFYSTKEFSIRNYAMHCCFKDYFVLPVFDEHKQFNKHNCVGVLEFIGFDFYFEYVHIEIALETAKLRSIHIDYLPGVLSDSDDDPTNIDDCKIEAMTELRNSLQLFTEIPQCYMVNVWVPNGKCIYSKSRCMKRELFKFHLCMPVDVFDMDRIHVEPRMGIIGMVLESESKSCFCRNIGEFSISDQLPSYHERERRCNACFAICLQSSHTGDLLYVVELFLYQGPATYEYLRSFLNFLLPILKHKLKSFKIANGKQLGEELVVEVIEFSEANQLTSSKSDQLDVFPITFKSVQYGQKGHQCIEDQQVQPNPKVRQRKQRNGAASNVKKTEKGKRKTSLHLSLLEPHFGKKLEEAAEELGVGRSTIKRACRVHGIGRWPSNKKQARNPSLFERESARDCQQDMRPSTRTKPQLSDRSLHQNVPPTNTESTHHQRSNSQDKSKDKKGSCPAKLHWVKRDENGDDGIVQIIDDNNTLLEKAVALTTGSTNAIVVYGTIVSHNEKSNLLHGQPFPKDCTHVSIDEVVNANASLPIPIPNVCNNVGDAIGTHVAWPNPFVVVLNKRPPEKKVQKAVVKERMVRYYASLPGPLKMLYSYAEHDLNDGIGILIALDNDVFGDKYKIYIHPEDIIPFCELEPISGNCIVVYIWHVYNKIKQENTIRRFQFVNPFTISYVPNGQPMARACALANRLIAASPNQLVLVPCNIGEHWILTIIEPFKEVVSLMDPLNHCTCDPSWEHVVNIAMSMFNANLKKKIIEQPTWKVIKVPRQPDLKQCGYYVMCYMKEIVQGLNTIDSSSLSSLFVKEEYSQADINEVRIEWAHCVQEHA